MNITTLSEEEVLLVLWLRKSKISPAELMLTEKMLRSASVGMSGRRQCVELGISEYKALKKTVSFRTCVEQSLKAKSHRRQRTLTEIRGVTKRMMRECPDLGGKMLRSLKADDCRRILEIFPTPNSKRKARTILHGIFAYGLKREWIDKNPVKIIDTPTVVERTIPVLTPNECKTLMNVARNEYGGDCLPAASLMLYAGIRPHEVRRLQFKHIRLGENCVLIPATHSKTGGARRVSLQPVLMKCLKTYADLPGEKSICPVGWERKWRNIRTLAGWGNANPWPQDVLRHSFASYHAMKFRDYTALQWEMGHASSNLLRTRYLNLEGVSKDEVKEFWLTT